MRITARTRLVAWAALPPLAVAVFALWAFWLRDGSEEPQVSVHESGVLVARAPASEALSMVETRVGFKPAVPKVFPIEGLILAAVDSGLPSESGVEAPISSLRFGALGQVNQPEMVIISQSRSIGVDPRDNRRELDVGQGAEAWELFPGPPRYLIRVGDVSVM